jgi:hypothetical protein
MKLVSQIGKADSGAPLRTRGFSPSQCGCRNKSLSLLPLFRFSLLFDRRFQYKFRLILVYGFSIKLSAQVPLGAISIPFTLNGKRNVDFCQFKVSTWRRRFAYVFDSIITARYKDLQ